MADTIEIMDIDPKTATVNAETGAIEATGMRANVSAQELPILIEVLSSFGKTMGSDYTITQGTEKGTSLVTVTNVTPEDMAIIQRKTNIRTWSKKTIALANTVTGFATNVADYALNAALAPTAVATANAALTTGRVVGTAAVKIGAGVLSSTIRNVRSAGTELYHSPEIHECGNELSGLWSDISNKVFGAGGNSKWTAC